MLDLRDDDEERTLLGLAQAGDEAAFAQLCERHRRRIWRVAAGVTRSPADADDLAQETILRALRALPSFRGEATFAAWICRIALNAAHDFQRSAWRRRVLLRSEDTSSRPSDGAVEGTVFGTRSTCPSDDPHEQAAQRETQRRVRSAVAALGAKERVPIYLIYFEEFSLADVARLEQVPESTIRSRVKVGLKRLGHTLGDLVDVAVDASPQSSTATDAAWSECRA